MIEINPDALSIADGLDRERGDGRVRGPLHGIPVLLKDNIYTGDRMETTAGSLALAGSHAPRDAFLVERLRAAGAVILGKTNLSEWANIRSTHSSSGWSAPRRTDPQPVRAGPQPVRLVVRHRRGRGGEPRRGGASAPRPTARSSAHPAATGLVGLKPTVGLVSRSGIVPISTSQDTAGPMARTVADAAILLGALVGVDPADPATGRSAGKAPADYTRFLDPDGLRGARIGVVREEGLRRSPPADRIFDAAVAEMRRQGAVIVDPADIPHLGEYDDAELEVLLYELKAGLDAFLPRWAPGARVRSLADVIAFDEAHAAEEMPFFGQELFVKAQAKGPLTDPAYRKALASVPAGSPGRRGSTRSSPDTGSTRSSPPPEARPGPSTS